MNANADTTKRKWVDPDDAPELGPEFFENADLYQHGKLVRRGGRPKAAAPKEHVSLRLSPEVVAAFRATGKGWQGRVDNALKTFLVEHALEDAEQSFPIELTAA